MRHVFPFLFCAGPLMADPAANLDWRFISDRVMGGLSDGRAVLDDGALHLSGKVSTQNNGGFIQARTAVTGFDADTKGVAVTVRGDGQTYYIHLRTSGTQRPWHFYQASFETTGRWQEVRLQWSDFAPSSNILAKIPAPVTVRSIALVAYGRDHAADVYLSDVGPY